MAGGGGGEAVGGAPGRQLAARVHQLLLRRDSMLTSFYFRYYLDLLFSDICYLVHLDRRGPEPLGGAAEAELGAWLRVRVRGLHLDADAGAAGGDGDGGARDAAAGLLALLGAVLVVGVLHLVQHPQLLRLRDVRRPLGLAERLPDLAQVLHKNIHGKNIYTSMLKSGAEDNPR